MVHARFAKLPRLAKAHILAELRFPNRIRRDAHNYYPTLKAIVDGLVDYGLLPDDSTEYLDGPDIRLGAPVPQPRYGHGGEVVLTIREVN
jgi:crossover junction endodeoxyribonuclease RusA